ncbi:isopentenyl-diphosphate delta-isomerase 2-like isoform X2 [Erinaceus europaeus]|nr:isopentenyl-diphosphate delta-isomerase 2-like isoform X2 [Erinaceus europaeus]
MAAATTTQAPAELSWVDERQRQRLNEMLIVVDRDNRVLGADTKRNCHLNENIDRGLLHRAFSVVLFNTDNRFLIQQRADTKVTFPGYFSESCSSHPLNIPEELEEKDALGARRAAVRRMKAELGIPPEQISPEDVMFMTTFHHKARFDSVWGEHEICHLLLVRKNVSIQPDINEVKSFRYVSREELEELLQQGEHGEVKVAPWLRTITQLFLSQWWPHLDQLDRFVEPHKIHRV